MVPALPSDLPHDATLLAGRFALAERVAAGGMGTVYRGTDLDTGRPAAIKLLRNHRDADLQRFDREIAVLASLQHPGIAQLLGHGASAAGARFLATEWVDGETLAARARRAGFSIAEAVDAVAQLAEALAVAHAGGIVHRDIKPQNAIITACGRAVLIDFGIAHIEDESGLTETGTVLGTPGYMSPEQARGSRLVCSASDVFGLGCLLYECIAGRPAFQGRHVMALRAKVMLSDPTPLSELCPDVPARLERLIATAMAKTATERPTASELAGDLRALRDLPTEPRRTVGEDLAETLINAPVARRRSVAVVAIADVTSERTQTDLERVARRFDTTLRWMADGSVVAVLWDDDARTLAERSVRCAVSMRRVARGCPIAVASAMDRPGRQIQLLDEAIDIGVSALFEHALGQLFGGGVADVSNDEAIRIDGGMAPLVGDQFSLIPAGAHALLVP